MPRDPRALPLVEQRIMCTFSTVSLGPRVSPILFEVSNRGRRLGSKVTIECQSSRGNLAMELFPSDSENWTLLSRISGIKRNITGRSRLWMNCVGCWKNTASNMMRNTFGLTPIRVRKMPPMQGLSSWCWPVTRVDTLAWHRSPLWG